MIVEARKGTVLASELNEDEASFYKDCQAMNEMGFASVECPFSLCNHLVARGGNFADYLIQNNAAFLYEDVALVVQPQMKLLSLKDTKDKLRKGIITIVSNLVKDKRFDEVRFYIQ